MTEMPTTTRSTRAISPETTVAEATHRSPHALAVFERMGVNHCCNAHLTLAQAAATAGLDVAELIVALADAALVPDAKPPMLADVPPWRVVALDVRPEIAFGLEPFTRIMAAVRALAAGEVVLIRAPFEPTPLYDVLGRRGFAHWTERHAADDWSVWFYRGADAVPPARSREASAAPMLDVRGLEPPQPMVRILERLSTLGAGEELVVLHDRRPLFLYPQLDERNFAHETEELPLGLIRIRIRAPRADAGP